MACNVMCIKKHLKICKIYLENLTNPDLWIIDKHNWKKQRTRIQAFISMTKIK